MLREKLGGFLVQRNHTEVKAQGLVEAKGFLPVSGFARGLEKFALCASFLQSNTGLMKRFPRLPLERTEAEWGCSYKQGRAQDGKAWAVEVHPVFCLGPPPMPRRGPCCPWRPGL